MTDFNLVYDKERFVGACELVALIEREAGFAQELFIPKNANRPVSHMTREGDSNIGGLGEGTLHLVLKNYISANREEQEIKCGKKYIDVFTGGKAYEIQTSSFGALKSKLSEFLPQFPVTVIYPVIRNAFISWVDPETGEMTAHRKSPIHENVYTLFDELIYIKDYLSHPALSLCVFELDVKETRLRSGKTHGGKRHGAARLNRVPTELHAVEYFENTRGLLRLLPENKEFSVKNIMKGAGVSPDIARKMIYCLRHAGIIEFSRAEGREKIYTLIK